MCSEVITGYDCQVLGVSSVHFGARNDQHIVRTDETVNLICTGWYKHVKWNCFDEFGDDKEDCGIYLICDGGYLRWPHWFVHTNMKECQHGKGYFSFMLKVCTKMWSMSLAF